MNKRLLFIFVLLGLLVVTGCIKRVVKRVEIDKVIDLSGEWNDTDSRLVAEEMIKDCLAKPWVSQFSGQNDTKPVVIVGTILNRSHEHINPQLFTKDLEVALLNSGSVTLVASPDERSQVRDERFNQQTGLTDEETIKPIGYETGADYMLTGVINSVKDELKNKYAILYQVNLELVDLKTNQKVWIGQKEIKKYVNKRTFSF